MHNSISLDGALTNFDVNMELHYQIADTYHPQAHLIGSNTVKKGLDLYIDQIPTEKKTDFKKPNKLKNLPLWVIIDSKGLLEGYHHIYRQFEFCKDVIILISQKTPKRYIQYLKQRSYDFIQIGKNHVDIKKALHLMKKNYSIDILLTDTGPTLNGILLNKNVIQEISLLIHPIIVGKQPNTTHLTFHKRKTAVTLHPIKYKLFEKKYLWASYKVISKKI